MAPVVGAQDDPRDPGGRNSDVSALFGRRTPTKPEQSDPHPSSAPPPGPPLPPRVAPLPPDDDYPTCGQASVELQGTNVEIADLPACDWGDAPWGEQTVALSTVPETDGRWRVDLTWSRPDIPDGHVAVYRVMIADKGEPDPFCQDVEATLVVTTDCAVSDASWINPPQSSTRSYSVWCYAGATLAEALRKSPYLLGAEAHVVWPPLGLTAVVTPGQVSVTWRLLDGDGARARWVKHPAAGFKPGVVNPNDAQDVPAGQNGFVDQQVDGGKKYVYSIFNGAEVAGDPEWSKPARVNATIPVVAVPVMDLQIQADEHRNRVVHLSWTPVPGANVDIYGSALRPMLNIHEKGVIQESLLEKELQLAIQDLQSYPVRRIDDRMWMRDVVVPEGVSEMHFTPVTRVRDLRAPGRTREWVKVEAPVNPFIEDRVDWVLVVFEWPAGATHVSMFVAGHQQAVDPSSYEPLATISQEDHARIGGFQIDRKQLLPGACALHLAGRRTMDSVVVYSSTVSVDHFFAPIVKYGIVADELEPAKEGKPKRFKWSAHQAHRAVKRRLFIRTEHAIPEVELKLVWSQRVFPLTIQDSDRVLKTIHLDAMDAGGQTIIPLAPAELPATGFVRLLSRPAARLALIDPPLSHLRLRGASTDG